MMAREELDAGPAPHVYAPEGGAPTPLPSLPIATDTLEIVAIGKTFNSRILWLQEHGSRVWLSGQNLDAYADGDGALIKGPDLLAKLPYKQGVHSMHVVGAYPHLFALRTKKVNGRIESPEPAVFVYTAEDGGPGTWKESKPLGMSWFPHAFVGYREGALIVNSQIQGNAGPYYTPGEPGTTLTYVAPDGTLSDPKLGLHPHFMAWGASSDRTTLTLLGTFAIPPRAKDEMYDASGAHLVRIGKDGPKKIALQSNLGFALETYWSRVHESGGKAVAIPPSSLTDGAGWRPNGRTVFIVDDDKPRPRTVAGDESCYVVDARVLGDDLYAIRRCYSADVLERMVRVTADGKTEELALPRLVKKDGGGFRAAGTDAERKYAMSCVPGKLLLRGDSDLWVTATCGGGGSSASAPAIPIVLRRGHAQEPVILP
jgi:hypothetical protein